MSCFYGSRLKMGLSKLSYNKFELVILDTCMNSIDGEMLRKVMLLQPDRVNKV